ncbi:hypothetical protein FIU97_04170 [Roseivivax sp. THAF40]|uniref:DUF6476 family protein n=1 Tax=unclassified Roseivivax TaxID=2639302 RepID=UPI001267F1C3|nr:MULTISPECIES: DUF6476 family protein [unclassified Roseivivax]QFS81964.1 hypothetical protein FIV09_03910 [Roseivivax sp. THAF197b]QFT45764.1 hypothetical protein FIU97_04170 [Roseivivax sp. THAF40]
MDGPSQPDPVPGGDIRFLKILVTTLTATMIAGLLVIIALFVIRFREPAPMALPDALDLPAGATALSVTAMTDRIIVVTDQDTVLVFAPDGTLRQSAILTPAE